MLLGTRQYEQLINGHAKSQATTDVKTHYIYTVNREIFVAEKFSAITLNDKIKPTKYFLRRINGVSLYCRVIIATKIKPRKHLTDEMFYRRKIPKLRY